jgi:hypothetical protein
MSAAAANYAAYREGEAAWALGRFVVPAARLSEFENAAATLLPARPAGGPWRLAALLGADPAGDARAIAEFNCRHAATGAGAVEADVVEARAGDVNAIKSLLGRMPEYLEAYVEIPVDRDPALLVRAIAEYGGRAKIRTGGVTPESFPSAAAIARFIAACVKAGVPFKATAGLHHPLRAVYPFTYAPDSPRGTMFGFLNLFLAAAFMAHGLDSTAAVPLLEESDPSSLRIAEDAVEWRGHRLGAGDIAAVRGHTIVSFGSCSFTEPLGDLATLGLLQRSAD